jgi:hypothetical protein
MVLEELKIFLAYPRDKRTIEDIFDDMRDLLNESTADIPRSSKVTVPEPLTLDELMSFLPDSGPLIICDTNGIPWSTPEFRRKWRLVAKKAGVPDDVTNRDSSPTGMIRGGPDRAKIRQNYSLKRIDYSLRMARRMSEDAR